VFSKDKHLRDRNDVVVEKEVSTSSNDIKGDDAYNSNKVPNDPKKNFPRPYVPPLSFLQRMAKVKLDPQFGKLLGVLKKLHINILFTDALSQMLFYAKFLKEILSNKRKLEGHETVALTEECSIVIQNKLPAKFKDPNSFFISCLIGNVSIEHALCDLGYRVSLMPFSLCKKLDLGEIRPTTISLQLADRSVKYPMGILADIPIKVGGLYVHVDFVILKMEEEARTPIILGRPFMVTAGVV